MGYGSSQQTAKKSHLVSKQLEKMDLVSKQQQRSLVNFYDFMTFMSCRWSPFAK